MQRKIKAIRKEEVYLIFSLCAISEILLNEVVRNVPYPEMKWRKFGIAEGALESLRDEIVKRKECFQEIHQYLAMRIPCPDPPCPSDPWLSAVCAAGLGRRSETAKSITRRRK